MYLMPLAFSLILIPSSPYFFVFSLLTLPLQETFFLCFYFPRRKKKREKKKTMARRRRKTSSSYSEEVSSIEWEFINMTEQEEDIIHRMHRLVGDRWGLIAGRIPGRKAEEIERFWIMTYGEVFATKREQFNRRTS